MEGTEVERSRIYRRFPLPAKVAENSDFDRVARFADPPRSGASGAMACLCGRLSGTCERVPLFRSPLFHFLLVGALLVGLKSTRTPILEWEVVTVLQSEIDERIATYRTQLGREPSEAETLSIENQVIEDALWLEQARALDLHKTDAIVRQRLVLNMQFLGGPEDASEDELFARAMALGMDRTDTVVRRRLIDRVQAMIRAGVRSRSAEESELRSHYERRASRWRQPALLSLTHVYFSRDKRGARTDADAKALLVKLIAEGVEPERAVAQADPFLSGHRLRSATPNRILALFGPAFADGVEGLIVGRWTGPVDSVFGSHLVWIDERVESRIPPFDEIRNRVREDWIGEEIQRALRSQIQRRRQVVEVRIVDDRANSPRRLEGSPGG